MESSRSTSPVPLGQVLAKRFVLRAQLGAGAFGTVYAADDLQHQVTVAIKFLTRISGTTIYRFKQEFRALSDLHHPNLVRLHQLFSEGDDWFFSMELLDGERFDQFVLGVSHVAAAPSTLSEEEVAVASPVAARGRPDLVKLRHALAQLVAGIQALHARGVLHRDLKPANVLVTRAGRVVLLDFGLATGPDADAQQSQLGHLVGTPTYMAPEQALGRATSAASDWYALGVMLFEALHGTVPFSGTVQDILSAKLSAPTWPWPAPPAGAEDLLALCRALLSPEPTGRPTGEQIAAQVGAAPYAPSLSAPLSLPDMPAPPFLGRSAELLALQSAWAETGQSGTIVLQVFGPSGVGKSALVRQFLQSVSSDAVVLEGRCYDRESVPYKALDGVADALTRYVRRLSLDDASLLVPREARALCRLFPVFARLRLIAAQPERIRSESPREERRRGFLALREMLARIGDRRRLVVTIDDLQWGDTDSLEPLQVLLSPPDPPRLLLILSYRSEDVSTSPLLRGLRDHAYSATLGQVRFLEVTPLPSGEAVALARRLLPPQQQARAADLARESGGSPFLLSELVRAQRSDAETTRAVSLDAVMAERYAALSEAARRLLEVVAVAGRPLPRAVAYRAASLSGPASDPAAAELVQERLVRHAAAEESLIETFHDRIRETVVAGISQDDLKSVHASVAAALEELQTDDPEALAEHYRLAGDVEHARPATVRAAQRAADAFAFDRAAALYDAARQGAPTEERRLLTSEVAKMLVYAGRGRAAAEAYIEAMLVASPQEEGELVRRAAEQLLRCGAIDEGLELSRQLLAESGLSYPESSWAVFASVLWQRLLLALRRFTYAERTPGPADAAALARIDLCWTLGVGLSVVDVVRAADFQARHLRYALDLGEPYRVSRGLGLEAITQAAIGAQRKAEALAFRAAEIAGRLDHPHALGFARGSIAIVDFTVGRWRRAHQGCTAALEILRRRSPESTFEIDLLEIWFKNPSLLFLGELEEFVAEATACWAHAEDRADPLALMTSQSLGMSQVLLIAGNPAEARELSSRGLGLWESGPQWRLQHQEDLRAQIACDLYEGEPKRALARIESTWPRVRASRLLSAGSWRVQSLFSYALAAVQAGDRRAFGRWYGRLAGDKNPWARALAAALQAGWLALERRDQAPAAYEKAAVQLDGLDMPLYAAALRRRRGELIGGEEGAAALAAADALLAGRGVAEPARWARMLAG